MAFTFDTDRETTKLFEVVVWCLERYFGHSHALAVGLVNDFYPRNAARFDDDDYHHEGPYRTAVRVHYFEFMRGDPKGFDDWRTAGGHRDTPREAMEYFREHYFEK